MCLLHTLVIEESTVSSLSVGPLAAPISDDVLVRISQVVGQDLNLFNGSRLVATSERDLYASGFLPTRTPDRVYRAIALDQLPSFVTEDVIGPLGFQLAAAPVRVGSQDLILTVRPDPVKEVAPWDRNSTNSRGCVRGDRGNRTGRTFFG